MYHHESRSDFHRSKSVIVFSTSAFHEALRLSLNFSRHSFTGSESGISLIPRHTKVSVVDNALSLLSDSLCCRVFAVYQLDHRGAPSISRIRAPARCPEKTPQKRPESDFATV